MAKFNVDFTGVSEGFTLLPEGDYICKVSKITVEDGNKGKYLKWELVVGTGPSKGQKLYHNTSLTPQALFNLRNTIVALGIDVPKQAFNIDTDKYVGKIVGVTVVHATFTKDGKEKTKAEIADLWRAMKTDAGWGRVNANAVLDTPTQDEDEVDLSGSVNGQIPDSEVDEIEI